MNTHPRQAQKRPGTGGRVRGVSSSPTLAHGTYPGVRCRILEREYKAHAGSHRSQRVSPGLARSFRSSPQGSDPRGALGGAESRWGRGLPARLLPRGAGGWGGAVPAPAGGRGSPGSLEARELPKEGGGRGAGNSGVQALPASPPPFSGPASPRVPPTLSPLASPCAYVSLSLPISPSLPPCLCISLPVCPHIPF